MTSALRKMRNFQAMKHAFVYLLLLLACCVTSCKKEKGLDEVLFGTWNVSKVEGTQHFSNGTSGLTLTDNNPSGYVRFDDDGTGEQNYTFTLFGTVYPNTGEFYWEADATEIRIDRWNQPDMVWRRITDEANKQEASYTIVVDATQSWDYKLTLTR